MFLELLYPLSKKIILFNVFKYITFRTLSATLTSLLLSIWLGKKYIMFARRKGLIDTLREEIKEANLKKGKEGIPSMGGLVIGACVIFSVLIWGNIRNWFVLSTLFIFILFGTLGFVDDLKKKIKPVGIKGRYKFAIEVAVATLFSIVVYIAMKFPTYVNFPFFKFIKPNLKWGYVLFGMLVIVGTANAVNLADGLDGLAMGSILTTMGVLMVMTYVVGHSKFSQYLFMPYIEGAGELAVFCGAVLGAGLGFLWYNAYPAEMFMGDTGALSLGAGMAGVALFSKQEFVLMIAGTVFVAEALSVILQVLSYRLWKKRIFRMAPLHHHFELQGIPEPKIMVRFWILSIIFALLALSTLKLR